MKRSIKCHHCGAWNEVTEASGQTCVDCGRLVEDEVVARKKKMLQLRKEHLDKWMFTPQDGDSSIIRFLKKIGNMAYFVFMAIVGFIAWLIAVLPL